MVIILFIENGDFLSESSSCKRNCFSNNNLESTKELDDFLQMPIPLKAFIPSLPGMIN